MGEGKAGLRGLLGVGVFNFILDCKKIVIKVGWDKVPKYWWEKVDDVFFKEGGE